MKRTLFLIAISFALSCQLTYSQTCPGSLSSTTVTPCLGQPFTISTPSSAAFGGSITWEVGTTDSGPWTSVGTSNFSGNTGAASFTITPVEAGVRYYRGVRTSCTYAAIMVTVGASTAPSPPTIAASTYCNGLATLTASGAGVGTYTWYRLNSVSQLSQVQSGPSNEYAIPALPNGSFSESSFRYYVTFSNGTCTSSASNILLVLPSGVLPPAPTITAESASVCVNKSTTLTATGSGTIKWYSTSPNTPLGEGSSITISPTSTKNYFATSTIDASCTSTGSNQVNVALALPTAVTTVPSSQDFPPGGSSARVLTDDNCQIFATFGASEPLGSELYSNTINAKVSFDNSVQTYNKMPYVQRHFDFHPTEELTPGYAPFYSITMYFTQAEFDAFNVISTVKLPMNQSDAEGYAANIRILHAYGTPNSQPARPGDYSANNVIEDCFVCTTVGWSTEYNAWAVSINTRGFSGFFITAVGSTSLPVTLTAFQGARQENNVALNWQTTDETNSDRFEIQHSTDGKQWIQIGQVNAAGESKTLQRYTYTHSNPTAGENLYKMKMVDADGTFAFSKIVSVRMNGVDALNVFPNPAMDVVSVTSNVPIVSYQLLATNGEVIREKTQVKTIRLELGNLAAPAGIYVLKMTLENGQVEHRKLVIR
ncbi:Ig-like domain-containing protein [Dyadobacter arcticus]|uniref:Por secretion system C-terminal sorting domain-containing protein n=1 Tax=Dyadobacter arcticus TaxID=1078754 RepID=A0ABX0UNU1_9BACT|nr:T9SS type A sorting domain-containing protein [Dyadobacter arcticus]NIJ53804.1 hypothetical protein [Dyadobacter arcticus]